MVNMIDDHRDLQDVNHNLVLSEVTPLESQVAGHSAKKGKSLDFLSHKDGYVLKPVFTNEEKGKRELEFYEELQNSRDQDVKELKRFVPRYFGTRQLKMNRDDVKWLVLANATHGFREPCIMDVKIGAQTWDPLASESKRLAEEAKFRECKQALGFCIPGFQVYKLSTGELIRKDRNYGKTLNGKTAISAIRTFLNGDPGLSRSLVLQFLGKLWKILLWFRLQTKYKFYSSSLLLVYDAWKLKQMLKKNYSYRPVKSIAQKPTLGRQLSLREVTGPLTPGFNKDHAASDSVSGSTTASSRSSSALGQAPGTADDWHKLFDNVCKTHSLENNYDKDLQTMRENYKHVLKDLVSKSSSDQYEVWVNVNMIDFAHVFHSTTEDLDKNYLNGLQNLVSIFEDFLWEAES